MSTSELVITELVFDNFFKDLEVEAIVAILSCMVNNVTCHELVLQLLQLQIVLQFARSLKYDTNDVILFTLKI